jgi:hypothetical protein
MMMFLCQQPAADSEVLADFYVTFRIVNLDFRREKCENIAGCVAYMIRGRTATMTKTATTILS